MSLTSKKERVESPSPSYTLAREESLGFFTDISDEEWKRIKSRVYQMQPNTMGNPHQGHAGVGEWFQRHYEPDFACRHENRIGSLGDGGKWICDPHLIWNKPDCLVYSVGSNGETSFEQAIFLESSNCEVHTFDFVDYSKAVEKTGAHFHQWGLSNETITKMGFVKKAGRNESLQYKTLADTVSLLGHENRTIDIFKIDCEGCEWDTVTSWFNANVHLRQVLIELHSIRKQGVIPLQKAANFFETMYKQGYVIFHKEPNIMFWNYEVQAIEYAFLLLNQSFFLDEITGESWLLQDGHSNWRPRKRNPMNPFMTRYNDKR